AAAHLSARGVLGRGRVCRHRALFHRGCRIGCSDALRREYAGVYRRRLPDAAGGVRFQRRDALPVADRAAGSALGRLTGDFRSQGGGAMTEVSRCPWSVSDPLYIAYHDEEWGVPEHDDRKLFEMLILEGAQAGLSWITILKRRDTY